MGKYKVHVFPVVRVEIIVEDDTPEGAAETAVEQLYGTNLGHVLFHRLGMEFAEEHLPEILVDPEAVEADEVVDGWDYGRSQWFFEDPKEGMVPGSAEGRTGAPLERPSSLPEIWYDYRHGNQGRTTRPTEEVSQGEAQEER